MSKAELLVLLTDVPGDCPVIVYDPEMTRYAVTGLVWRQGDRTCYVTTDYVDEPAFERGDDPDLDFQPLDEDTSR